jgi:hypothetical protein
MLFWQSNSQKNLLNTQQDKIHKIFSKQLRIEAGKACAVRCAWADIIVPYADENNFLESNTINIIL